MKSVFKSKMFAMALAFAIATPLTFASSAVFAPAEAGIISSVKSAAKKVGGGIKTAAKATGGVVKTAAKGVGTAGKRVGVGVGGTVKRAAVATGKAVAKSPIGQAAKQIGHQVKVVVNNVRKGR
jgi:hypothetical protein